ncbi:trigger factor [Texas Phoenix palm phytoplasma]|uniref:Trigger factor n=1 Tax=Texas Phoenix palm phytoplasma TaxID=176709 RepID=A0ABS5BHY8_9MOLU|nr:trigger factor [Texas Phoenix palm phytoplasma]MBP3059195.1 trigger factor [Texas Phoenix palm phytoplasma]
MQFKKISDEIIQYNFEIVKKEFDYFIEKSFKEIQSQISVKGFRKGFVTRNVFEKKFGIKKLYNSAFENLVQEKVDQILKNNNDFKILENYKITNFQLEDLYSFKEKFNFSIEFTLKPEITFNSPYKGIKLNSNLKKEITEKEIQNKIDLFLESNNLFESKKEESFLEKGDIAVFDFKGFLNDTPLEGGQATNYFLEIGSNKFVPGFEKEMIGMKKKEEKIIKVFFPSDYNYKNLASKEVKFKIFLHDIKIKKTLTLDEKLIKNLQIPNINSIKEFKDYIKKQLEYKQNSKIEEENKKKILEFLIKNSNVKIPLNLVKIEKQNLINKLEEKLKLQNIDLKKYLESIKLELEKFHQEMDEKALKNLKINFLLEEISEKEKITIQPEELELAYQQLSLENNVNISKIKENLSIQEYLKKHLLQDKTIKFLLENVNFISIN